MTAQRLIVAARVRAVPVRAVPVGAALPLAALLAITLVLAPLPHDVAHASPWTVPQGAVAVTLGTEFVTATDEWLPDGTFQEYPLDGRFTGYRLRLTTRIGLTDRTELSLSTAYMQNNFNVDGFYLGAPPEELADLDQLRDGFINLQNDATGIGDVFMHLRSRLATQRRWLLTSEIELRVPTRYGRPTGTFINDDPSQGVGNQVALGEGRVAAGAALLLGLVPTSGLYITQTVGFRYRFEGPPPQLHGAFKIGGRVAPMLVPWFTVDGVWSLGTGDSVGLSFITSDPSQPANRFDPSTLTTIERTLDEAWLRLGVGTTIPLGTQSIDFGYYYVALGRSTARSHTVSASVIILIGGP